MGLSTSRVIAVAELWIVALIGLAVVVVGVVKVRRDQADDVERRDRGGDR